jgi:hypothetical protein
MSALKHIRAGGQEALYDSIESAAKGTGLSPQTVSRLARCGWYSPTGDRFELVANPPEVRRIRRALPPCRPRWTVGAIHQAVRAAMKEAGFPGAAGVDLHNVRSKNGAICFLVLEMGVDGDIASSHLHMTQAHYNVTMCRWRRRHGVALEDYHRLVDRAREQRRAARTVSPARPVRAEEQQPAPMDPDVAELLERMSLEP